MTFRLWLVVVFLLSACPAPRRVRPESRATRAQIGLPGPDAKTPTRLRMHVIDIGQGAATLFEFPCAAVLIDTGGESTSHFDSIQVLKDYLEAFFARRTDLNRTLAAVFITHPHIDHTRGLPLVMKDFNVGQLITNGQPRGVDGLVLESGGEAQELAEQAMKKRGALRTVARTEVENGKGLTDAQIDPVQCEGIDPQLTVFWGGLKQNTEGWEQKTFANANNHSLVVRVDVGGHPVLVTGDLETEAIHALLAAHGSTLNSDVFLVGHHGSHNGTTMGLMKTLTPCMAVISMGAASREEDWTAWVYGHPRKAAVQTVAAGLGCSRPRRDVQVATGQRRFEGFSLTTALYGTGWEGTVVLEENEFGSWRAFTER
ncbi:MAG: MBL fold metallo-hydrolase [Archangium sp.]|nr:MBL fold metallo-hydrolase [Archangium sp.]